MIKNNDKKIKVTQKKEDEKDHSKGSSKQDDRRVITK
jgi:hypothetical protein